VTAPRETAGALDKLLDIKSWHAVENSKILRGPHVNRTVAVSYLDEACTEYAALRASQDRAEEMERHIMDLTAHNADLRARIEESAAKSASEVQGG
jgi:hypothetical protein